MAQGAARGNGHREAGTRQRRRPVNMGGRHQRKGRRRRLRCGQMAHLHCHTRRVSPPGAQDALRHPRRAPERWAGQRRDMPRPAQGRVDARVQRAGVRARGAHAAELSRDGQPAQRGCGGVAEGGRCHWGEEAG